MQDRLASPGGEKRARGSRGSGALAAPVRLTRGRRPSRAQQAFQNKTLRPATVQQLMMAAAELEDNFQLDGKDVSQVAIVGVVRSVQTSTTNMVYHIEDGTGAVNVRMWVDADESESSKLRHAECRCAVHVVRLPLAYGAPLMRRVRSENRYVRVTGSLRMFNQQRQIVAYHIRPIEDMNEITMHFLECIAAHLMSTCAPAVHREASAAGAAYRPAGPQTGGGQSLFNRDQTLVHEAFQRLDTQQGCFIDDIINELRGQVDEAAVRCAAAGGRAGVRSGLLTGAVVG